MCCYSPCKRLCTQKFQPVNPYLPCATTKQGKSCFAHFRTTVYHFFVASITCTHYFSVVRQYPLRSLFVSHADILHAFHSTHCTMPNFSMPHYATTKLLCALPILCTPRVPLLFFHAAPKFSAHTHTPTFSAPCQKFSVHTIIPTFSRTVSRFRAHTITPLFSRPVPNFSACTRMLTCFYAVPNYYIYQAFTVQYAFLVCPHVHIHFYAHEFLVNSAIEIGDFS